MKYGLLAQKNPTYTGDRWEELEDLYVGGYQLVEKARRYMPRFVGENTERYQERLRAASYLAYMGQVTDYFVSNLFSQELTVTPEEGTAPDPEFYDAFARDADLRGTSLVKLLRGAFTTALVKGKAIIAVDMPAQTELPVSRVDEEEHGAGRAYAFEVAVEQLLDWEYGDDGWFEWAILHRLIAKRDNPSARRGLVIDEFKVWTMHGGVARWELYRGKPRKPDVLPKDDLDIPLAASGTTTFKRIPLVEMPVPAGLWVGNKLGCLAREHFTRRSALNAAENKSLFAIPYVKLGPEISAPGEAMPAEVQQNPNRGRDPAGEFNARGYVVLGKEDDIGFAEPAGHAYELVAKQLEDLVDEMFRVVHQMAASVSNTSVAVGRAGASKVEDRRATEIVLAAYGALVRDFATRIYRTISEARGEDVTWTPHGLDKYELEDRDAIVKEALAVDNVGIPSPTFKKLYKTKLAYALVGNVPPDVQDEIREEIESGVEHELELKELMNEAILSEQQGAGGGARGVGHAAKARQGERRGAAARGGANAGAAARGGARRGGANA